jgi:divalent metal cation (Fe/Co/Zn/Cd) transporter
MTAALKGETMNSLPSCEAMGGMLATARPKLVRRGLRLTYATLAYNSLEGLIAIIAGLTAGSVALVGFGLDSVIEVTASAAAVWRLHADRDPVHRALAERRALRLIGASFLALAGYVTYDAAVTLFHRHTPEKSPVGIILAVVSLAVMPLLARAKRRVSAELQSDALAAEATQTAVCAYLSAILLGGLVFNALVSWWWADPVAALVMVPLIVREGVEGLRGRAVCADCSPIVNGQGHG